MYTTYTLQRANAGHRVSLRVRIEGLLVDDDNAEKFAMHGLNPRQVLQILANRYVIMRNRKRRRAQYLLIGRDDGGICIAIPIEATRDKLIWRPVTAWHCKYYEEAKLT